MPEIDKGPLFIRQRKFERASRMIEEMRYLTDQVEDTVNRIEGGVQEDQEIEKRVRELVHSFKEDRQEVQDIISPRQEREG